MPVVCVFVPAYNVEVARLSAAALRAAPVLVVDRLERGHVIDLDARAFALGARKGMTLLQAGACAREALTVVNEPARDQALWDRVLDALDAASPLVEDAGHGTAFLEMRGIDGTPACWLASIREALTKAVDEAGQLLPFAFGVAVNRFVAMAAARVAAAEEGRTRSIEPGSERAFLAPLPLEMLDLHGAAIERLRLLGIRTLGDLARLPHGPFVRRFGPAAARWHACSRGIDDVPLVPRPRMLRIDRALYGEGTADREDQVLFALRTIVTRIAGDVAFAGKRCGVLRLVLECEDGDTVQLPTTLAQPTAQATTMFDLLRARLEGVTLRAPVVGLRLGAERLEEGGAPQSLFASDDPDPESVGIALARLQAALGDGNTVRARIVEGNRYETRFRYEQFSAEGLGRSALPRRAQAPAPYATLTLRLVEPSAIDVVLRSGLPALVGTPPQEVLDVAGPWRVDEAWWDDMLETGASATVQRDEYDVLLTNGTLWRIARDAAGWTVRGTYD